MMLGNYTRAELVRRPGRALLTLAGIVIGVTGVVAIALVINATRAAYREMFADLTGRAALEIVAAGGGGFSPAEADAVAHIPGVQAAVPVVQKVAALVTPAGPTGVMVLGRDARRAQAIHHEPVRQGRDLDGPDEALLVESFAASFDVELGASLRMITQGGAGNVTVVGLLPASGPAGFNGGGIAFVSLDTAQRLFRLDEQVTAVQIVLDDDVDVAAASRRIAAALPAGLSVQAPATRGQLAQESLVSTEQGLATLSAVSIVAGGFVILNSFLMSLGERRRQLAILRAVGVTRRQVTRLLLREALILGLVGTVAGMALGVGVSIALTRGMQQLMGIHLAGFRLSAGPFALALAFGPGMALAAAFTPARRAARRPPLNDLLGLGDPAGGGFHRRPFQLGLVLLVVSLVLIVLLIEGGMPPVLTQSLPAPLMAAFLVASILVAPGFYPAISRLVARLLGPWWGVEGRLAARQLDRNANRSALTAAVLCAALIVAIGMGQSLRNNIRDVAEWTRHTITADYIVRSTMPDLGFSVTALLPEALRERIAALPGVERVDALNFVPATAGGQQVIVMARSFSAGETATLDVADGEPRDVMRGLLAGQAVLGTALAQRLNLTLGDAITIRTRRGEHTLRVAGTVTEYVVGGMAVYLERNGAKALFGLEGVDAFMTSAEPGRSAELGRALAALCQGEGLLLQSNTEFRQRIDHMMAGIVGFLWLLMGLVFVVASLGIVNTLTMNVLEQTREIAVLRAVAMQRRQIRKLIVCQALSLGLGSLLPGSLLGMVLALLMNRSTHVLTGQRVEFHLDPGFVLGCCAISLLVAVVAASLPAIRAARLAIVDGLKYE